MTEPLTNQHSSFGLAGIWNSAQGLQRFSRRELSRYIIFEALRAFKTSPITTIVSIITMALALVLFGAFLLLMENLHVVLAQSQSEVVLNMFLKDEASVADTETLRSELVARPEVLNVKLIDKSEALQILSKSLGGDKSLLDGLDSENPLPASFVIRIRPGEDAEGVFSELKRRYQSYPLVDTINYNSGLLGQLDSVLKLFRTGGLMATGFMLLMTGFIIANTIKLALYLRHEEIEIMRLVGATGSFIRAPYLLEGVLQGFIASTLSLAGLYIFFRAISGAVSGSEMLSLVLPQLHFLSILGQFGLVFVGMLVSLVGSFFAVRPFLHERT